MEGVQNYCKKFICNGRYNLRTVFGTICNICFTLKIESSMIFHLYFLGKVATRFYSYIKLIR